MLGREPGVDLSSDNVGEQAHYPPLYSGMLAVGSLAGADPLAVARWLHAALLAGSAILASEMVRRSTASQTAALFSAAAVALSPGTLSTYSFALSEPLFTVLSLLCVAMLVGLCDSNAPKHRWTRLLAAAVLAGLGILTRYAGWAVVPAGAAITLLLSRQNVRRRWIEAAVFIAVAAAGPIGWSVRNALVLGSATNRVIAFHPAGLKQLVDLGTTAGKWLFRDEPHAWMAVVGGANVVIVLIGAVWLAWRDRREVGGALPAAILIYIGASVALLVGSISLIDYDTPVDARILTPVYVAWLMLVGCLLADVLRRRDATTIEAGSMATESAQSVGAFAIAAWSLALLLGVWSIGRSAALVHSGWRDGGGFAHRLWRESPTIAALRDVPADRWIYTNAPGAVYLLTGRPIIFIVPPQFIASSGKENPDYARQVEAMRTQLVSGRAVIVYLDRYAASRANYPKAADLKKRLGLHPVARRRDGTIFDYVAPSATAPASQPSE